MASLSFIYLFLPVGILLFYGVPRSWKLPVLALLSAVFYLLHQPRHALVLGCNLLADFALLQLADRARKEDPASFPRVLALCGAKAAAVLGYVLFTRPQNLPLGLFVYTVNLLGYLHDLMAGEAEIEPNLVYYSLFTAFFGRAYVGPVVRYASFMPALKQLRPSLSSISRGLVTFILGLAKKVILADGMIALCEQLRAVPVGDYTASAGWALAVSAALSIFFTIAAYSDMARGVCAVFSIDVARGIYYPYQATRFEDCISRLNMPLYGVVSDLCAAEVRPARASRHSLRELLPAFAGVLAVCLWVRFSPAFFLWGLFMCAMVCGERLVYYRVLRYFPQLFQRLFTYGVVLLSLVPVALGSLGEGLAVIGRMLALGAAQAPSEQVLYLLSTNYLLLLAGLLLSTSLLDVLAKRAGKRFPRLTESVSVVLHCSLLVVTTALML